MNSRFLIFSLLLASMIFGFNNCQEVKFDKSEASATNTDPGPGSGPNPGSNPGPAPAPKCEVGYTCPDPTKTLVNKSQNFTVPAAYNKVDVMLVMDNSDSMTIENAQMGQRLGGLVSVLNGGGIDWQMCYTKTDVKNNGQSLQWVGTTAKVLNASIPNLQTVFVNTTNGLGVGGSGNEQAIAATRLAVNNSVNSNCFRTDAALAVLILSDEDERSCGGRCQNAPGTTASREPANNVYPNWFASTYRNQYSPLTPDNSPQGLIDSIKTKWPVKPFTAHAVTIRPGDEACLHAQDYEAPAFYGIEYQKLQSATGGILGNICANDYATQVREIGVRIQQTLASVTLECPPLASPAPVLTFNPASSAQPYKIEGNKIIFTPAVNAGTQLKVDYTCEVVL